ncbi:transposase [uncultured Ruegeria sp.]|uniref:transposase n=1 Tax=uncultured Ruegeria sp. TaxID=259304 RepID=UPI00345B81A2
MNTTIASTVVAEIGDMTRIDNQRQLMAWLGLVTRALLRSFTWLNRSLETAC